jgi:RNA-binding protein YhbY
MKLLCLLFVLSTIIWNNLAFLNSRNSFLTPSISILILNNDNINNIDEKESIIVDKRWLNPNYSQEQLNIWFCSLDKSLLTIGNKGVTSTHASSLYDLLSSHERVRVKIASDRLDIKKISDDLLDSECLLDKVELLEVRRREFMVGRKKGSGFSKIEVIKKKK